MATTVFDLMARLGIDTSGYEKGLKGAMNAVGSAAKIGAQAVGAATAAVTAFGASSVKVGAEFDSSMSQVAATMGKTTDEIGDLRDFAQEMGRTTAFSATQAADALNYMALAGYNTDESMSMLPNVLNLAAAGSMDLARASDMVTDTQTAFGISAERTTQMVDEMAKAASTGNTSVEQLGDAFLTVGGLAQELNGGMVTLADGTTKEVDGVQELEIALTAMANAGVKGSEAGTHMRNMLLKLSSPTDAGTKALEAMGVAVFNAEGDMRSLKDVMGDLNGALSTMTQEEKIKTISDLFNTRDLASAEALLNAVGEDWDEIGESILNAEGAASKMAGTQLDNLAGDVTLFKSALEGAQIAISDELTPTLRNFVDFGTHGLSQITEAFQEGGLEGAMDAFGKVLSGGLTMILEMMPEMVDAGAQLLGALGQGLMDNIDKILFAAGDIIEELMNGLLEATSGQDSKIIEIINWILGVFAENYMTLIDTGMQILENIINGMINGLPEMIGYMADIVEHIGQALIDNLPLLITSAFELIKTLALGIAQALPDLIPTIVDVVLTIVESLIDNVDLLIDAAIALIVGLAEGIVNALPRLIEKAPVIIEKLVMAIVNNVPKLIEAAVQIVIKLVSGIIQNLPKLVQAAVEIIGALVKGIINSLGKIVETGARIKDSFYNAIRSAISSAGQWGGDLIDSFVNGIKNAIGKVTSAVSSVANTVKSYLHFSEPDVGPLANFSTYAPDMMKLFAQGIADNTDVVTDQIEKSFNFGNLIESSDLSANGAGSYNNAVTINVYGAEGQDVNALAEIISEKINNATKRQIYAWGGA